MYTTLKSINSTNLQPTTYEELPVKNGESNESIPPLNSSYYIDLKDPCFKNDFGPLIKGCSCYACRKVIYLFKTRSKKSGIHRSTDPDIPNANYNILKY